MTTMAQVRMRKLARGGSLKYEIYLTVAKDPSVIREWCNESFGDCHLLWSADWPGELYSFNCKKDAVLFSLRWS